MSERFLYFFNTLRVSLGSAGVFLCCILIAFVAFLIVAFLSIFKCGYGLKKRTWFFIICFSTLSFQFALSFFSFDSVGYGLLSLSVYLLLSIPILSIRRKEQKDAREFAKFIDKHVKQDNASKEFIAVPRSSEISLNAESFMQPAFENVEYKEQSSIRDNELNQQTKTKKKNGNDIDFTHVKNVISRLDFYGLSSTEKKTVLDLERAINYAETEGPNEQIRVKINDGLGALLKIMSKYGV